MPDPAGRTWPTPDDDHDRKLLNDVREHGWHVVGIAEDDEGPAFAYTVGLYESFGAPEIVVFGLDIDVLWEMLNGIGERVREGQRFGDLDESEDVLADYNVIFRTVERPHYPEYLGCARWFYEGDRFSVLQCVWPDRRHRYPWHPEFPAELAARQPRLYGPGTWRFQAGRNRAVFATALVTGGTHPVLRVCHDDEGDWQFLCGTTNRQRDAQLVSLGSVIQQDPTLAELADLPEGWVASRPVVGAAWRREPLPG